MSLQTQIIKLKDELDNGNLPLYSKDGSRNFLDEINPLNKKGVFSDYIKFLEDTINDKRFTQLTKSQQKSISDELNLIKQTGETKAEEILQDYGISLNNSKKMRTTLKSNNDYEPVLVLNPDTGVSEWDIANIYNLTPKAKATNGYETFRIYGENGRPQMVNIKGIPEDYDMKEQLAEAERQKIMDMMNLGNDFESLPADMRKQIDSVVNDNLAGLNTKGVRYYYHFPNGNIIMIDKSTGDRNIQNPQNGNKILFQNPITQENDFYTEVTYNQRSKELYDLQKETVKKYYKTLLKKQDLTSIDNDWVDKQLTDGKQMKEILNEITNLPDYLILQKLGQAMSFMPPEELQKIKQQNQTQPVRNMTPAPNMTPNVSMPGVGALPNASMARPGQSTERAGGIPSLADVRNMFKNLKV